MPEQIIKMELSDKLGSSYLDYAMSVIVSRALPDARDGLKPVQRRVLFSMHELGLEYNKSYRKCARTVGDVLGKTHPHGDSSVYEAMVRLAQDFSLRYPLVDGHGNFGSLDGEKAAAMRYTEAKLTKIGTMMLKDLEKTTVDFKENFDNTLQEPTVLSGIFPNLLANGSSGIAVGMATNMAPHNVSSIYEACLKTIDANLEGNDLSVLDVANIIKAPDFPTGGIICNPHETLEAMTRGYGRVITRAKHNIEEEKNCINIVYTEIPYMVNKADLVEKIHEAKELIPGMREVRDESSKDGIRIVVELRKTANINLAVNTLFKKTRLQTSFSINNVAIVDGIPKQLNVKELLDHFLAHVAEVITRRTQYDLDKTKARLHLVEGFMTANNHIDAIIETIKASETNEEAVNSLMSSYSLSEEQAKAVADMRLKALTSQSIAKLQEEHGSLSVSVAKYTAILSDDESLLNQMKIELLEMKEEFGDERRTEISYDADTSIKNEDLIEDETLVLVYTKNGSIKTVDEKEYKTQGRNGKGSKAQNVSEDDAIVYMSTINSKDDLLFLTNTGRCHKLKAYDIDKASRTAKGKHVANYLNLAEEETIVTMVPAKLTDESKYLLLASKKGVIKRVAFDNINSSIKIIKVLSFRDGDELLDGIIVEDGDEFMLTSSKGFSIRIKVDESIRPMGRQAAGVKGIALKDDEYASDLIKIEDDTDYILTVSENGLARRTKTELFKAQARGGKGMVFYKPKDKSGQAVSSAGVNDSDEVLIATEQNQMIRLKSSDISIMGRTASGVKAINLSDGDKVLSVSKVKEDALETEIDDDKQMTL